MALTEFWYSCYAFLPEIILAVGLCLIIFADMLVPFERSRKVSGSIAIAVLVPAIAVTSYEVGVKFLGAHPLPFYGTLIKDNLGLLLKLVIVTGTLLSALFALSNRTLGRFRAGEFYALLLGAAWGGSLVTSANNFIVLLLAFETLSMCSYVLAASSKHEIFSAEAGLKYTLYGAVASGVMLFGLSFFYGLSGTLNIQDCMRTLTPYFLPGNGGLIAILSLILVLAGLGFKIAMVPFHFWCPDTYEGAPTPVTAFLSVVSKTAGFAALLRVFVPVLLSPEFALYFTGPNSLGMLQALFGAAAAITMTYGNLAALRQTNLKRLLAYSAIAHAGYLLMAFSVFDAVAVQALVFYLIIYLFMNLGAFWVVQVLENHLNSCDLSAFRGLAKQVPTLFVIMFICLVALTGLPPTAGFVAKFQLFSVVVSEALNAAGPSGAMSSASIFYLALAVLGALNSAVSLYYYMKVAKVMVFEERSDALQVRSSFAENAYAIALAVPVLLFLNFGPIAALVRGTFNGTVWVAALLTATEKGLWWWI